MNASGQKSRFPLFPVVLLILSIIAVLGAGVQADSGGTASGTISTAADAVPVHPAPGQTITLYLFESSTCLHCAKAEETIRELMAKYPSVQLVDFEVSGNATARRVFEAVIQEYNVTTPGVPLLLISGRILQGDVEIRENLESIILAEMQSGNLSPTETVPALPSGSEPQVRTSEITVPLVLAAAFADGLNPCALAVLVFLIVTILAVGDRRKALFCGFAYTLAIFILYFLAGLGISSGIRASGVAKEIYLVAAAIAIVAGLLSLRDAFSPGKPPLLKIPVAAGGLIRKYTETASVPASLLLGFLVGLFEMPCTGAIYFSVLNLISSNMTSAQGLAYLALYNLIFILPLIIVIVAVYYGLPVRDAEGWRARNMRRLRLMSGIVLLVTGIVMFVFLRG